MKDTSVIFLVLVLLWTGIRLYLNHCQLEHVQRHRDEVPKPFDTTISLDEHQKAADYTVAKGRMSNISLVVEVLLLLTWTSAGGLQWLTRLASNFSEHYIVHGLILVIGLLVISSIIQLPLTLWNTFKIEKKFGFNNTDFKTFIQDRLKGLLLFAVIGIPILSLIFWLLNQAGEFWWLYSWLVWTGFGLVLGWAYPTFIAPLFNKFSELDDQSLLEKINILLKENGFNNSGVYVMDGSKRSNHGNAYFTGLGKSKRIVFFDTLLESLSHQQIIAVLAHELGHFKHKHIRKSLIVNAVLTLLGFYLIDWFIDSSLPVALGVTDTSQITLLILFVLVSPILSFYIQPLFSWWSRKNEFEADAFAKQKASAKDLVSALLQMYRDNASSLTPDPLYSRIYYSHPPAHERIIALEKL